MEYNNKAITDFDQYLQQVYKNFEYDQVPVEVQQTIKKVFGEIEDLQFGINKWLVKAREFKSDKNLDHSVIPKEWQEQVYRGFQAIRSELESLVRDSFKAREEKAYDSLKSLNSKKHRLNRHAALDNQTKTPEQVAEMFIKKHKTGFGMPIWEVISQFESILDGNDLENIRQYYPNWSDDDFRKCLELLKPYEDDEPGEMDYSSLLGGTW
jgi:hypothetical protein